MTTSRSWLSKRRVELLNLDDRVVGHHEDVIVGRWPNQRATSEKTECGKSRHPRSKMEARQSQRRFAISQTDDRVYVPCDNVAVIIHPGLVLEQKGTLRMTFWQDLEPKIRIWESRSPIVVSGYNRDLEITELMSPLDERSLDFFALCLTVVKEIAEHDKSSGRRPLQDL
jgi:hypothetical protein